MWKALVGVAVGIVFMATVSCDRSAPQADAKKPGEPAPSQPVDGAIAAVWAERGFEAGWIGALKKPGFSLVTFEKDQKLVAESFPAFRLTSSVGLQDKSGLKGLPVVGVPFGVILGATTQGRPGVTDDMVKELAGQPNLIWLDLSGTQVTDAVLQNLVGLTSLNYLNLPERAITNRALETLAGAGRLHALYVAHTEDARRRPTRAEEVARFGGGSVSNVIGRQVTDDGVKHLSVFTNLKGLHLGVMNVGFQRGADSIKTGQVARLPTGGARLTDACLKHLVGLHHLESLDLTDAEITDAGVKEIARHPGLTTLALTRTEITDASWKDLAGMKKLTRIDVRGTQVTASGVTGFQAARPDCKVEH